MRIADPYRSDLLRLPRVGERVVCRLERAGFHSMESLASTSVSELIRMLVRQSDRQATGNVWARSSSARAAICAVVRYARSQAAAAPR